MCLLIFYAAVTIPIFLVTRWKCPFPDVFAANHISLLFKMVKLSHLETRERITKRKGDGDNHSTQPQCDILTM